jgi:hypothetical protein
MTLQATQGLWMPPFGVTYPPAATSTVIDASGEKVAWVGQVFTPNRGSKNIQTVGFLPGAITAAGGSNMRLSLQNVDTTTGFPFRPDGTQDQTVDFLISAPTASTWYQTGNLSATRTVAHGDLIAVVLEFETFAGADVFNVQNLSTSSTLNGNWGLSHFTASWGKINVMPNVVLGFDDGSFGTLSAGAFPFASLTTDTISSSSTPDEVALRFTVPFACKLDGAWIAFSSAAAGRNFDVVLYEGTSALATVPIDADTTNATAGTVYLVHFAEQTLAPSTVYYVAAKPTTTGNGVAYSYTVSNANHFQAAAGGTEWHFASRSDAGAWSATTTKRLHAGILVSALHDGAGGGARVIGG